MKKADKIGITIVDASTIDFSVLNDIVYTLKSIEFDESIYLISIHLHIDGEHSTIKLTISLNNEWNGVSTKVVSYIYLGEDVDGTINMMEEEYKKWWELSMEDKMKQSYTKFPNIIKDGVLTYPEYKIFDSLKK